MPTNNQEFSKGDIIEFFPFEGCRKIDCVKGEIIEYLGNGDYSYKVLGQSRGEVVCKTTKFHLRMYINEENN